MTSVFKLHAAPWRTAVSYSALYSLCLHRIQTQYMFLKNDSSIHENEMQTQSELKRLKKGALIHLNYSQSPSM